MLLSAHACWAKRVVLQAPTIIAQATSVRLVVARGLAAMTVVVELILMVVVVDRSSARQRRATSLTKSRTPTMSLTRVH